MTGVEALEARAGGVAAYVPFAALDRQHTALAPELCDAFERVIGASAFILGTEVEAFEHEFAAYCGVSHCAGVASGTAALGLALMAAGIGPGDEVVVPAHTFIASALGVLHAGATPVFCDVERDTGLIDPESAEAAIGPRTSAILAVHLYGQACDMGRIVTLAERHGLFVLEDAAQAHGATYDGRKAGSLGHAAAFSFYPSKNLGALGDGGAVLTNDAQLAGRVRELRNLGQRGKGEHVRIGFNERVDGLQAALLRVKLPHLDSWNERRMAHAARLREALPESLACLTERTSTPCVFHLFPVRHSQRDLLVDRLCAGGVQAGIHYTPAVHRHAAFAELPVESRPIALAEAEAWAAQELSLPMFAELMESEIDHMTEVCTRTIDQLSSSVEAG
jgi:dTDP-4-amino-4,6-dideoxygalactose transaminase